MRTICVFCLMVLVAFLNINCKKNNPLESSAKYGKRDFTWTIDSVDYGNLPGKIALESIWGSSPDDVWGASYSSDVRDCLWHFDGKVWKRATENTPLTTPGLGSREVGHIWGSGPNDIWAIGGRIYGSGQNPDPFVMHYNGVNWTEVSMLPTMPIGSNDILGIGKDDFWVAGVGTITHYYHGMWKRFSVGDSMTNVSKMGLIGGAIYATSYQIGNTDLYLLKQVNDKFITIDTTNVYSGTYGHSGLIQVGNKVYSFGFNRIASAEIKNNEIDIQSWQVEISLNGGFGNSFFCNQNNIWAGGYPSNLYNFNGNDWRQIQISVPQNSIPFDCGFYGMWTNGDEIIVCDSNHGIIYHGK